VRRDAAASDHSAIAVRQPAADVVTAHRAALLELRQRLPRFEDRLLGPACGRVERDCDLVV
jgi:hypothetical protein